MRSKLWKSVAGLGLLALAATPLHAATGWIESIDGDLSNDGLAPTAVTLALGANPIAGTTGNPGTGVDRDFFTFSVPAGLQWSGLMVKPDTFVSGSVSFIAFQTGSQIVGNSVQGFSHYGPETVGTNLLPALLGDAQATLSGGPYTVWIQETGGTVQYSFDFILTAVPEPASLALFAVGALAVSGRLGYIRRKARSATTPQ